MKTLLKVAAFSASIAFSSLATAETPSTESVRELMDKTGAGEMGMQVIQQMLPALQQMAPDAPAAFWQDFASSIDPNEMVEKTIPIYQKYLSQKDVDAISKFFDSPEGKKLISVQPAIMQESMMVGQAWGQELAQQVLMKYQEQQAEAAE